MYTNKPIKRQLTSMYSSIILTLYTSIILMVEQIENAVVSSERLHKMYCSHPAGSKVLCLPVF